VRRWGVLKRGPHGKVSLHRCRSTTKQGTTCSSRSESTVSRTPTMNALFFSNLCLQATNPESASKGAAPARTYKVLSSASKKRREDKERDSSRTFHYQQAHPEGTWLSISGVAIGTRRRGGVIGRMTIKKDREVVDKGRSPGEGQGKYFSGTYLFWGGSCTSNELGGGKIDAGMRSRSPRCEGRPDCRFEVTSDQGMRTPQGECTGRHSFALGERKGVTTQGGSLDGGFGLGSWRLKED